MSDTRLSLAIEAAGGLPASGRILVLRPTTASDLGSLPPDRADLVTGFYPDAHTLATRGYQVGQSPEGTYAAAVLFLPRSRAFAHGLVAEAVRHLAPGASLWVDGQKTDGIEPLWRDVRARAEVTGVVTKSHGRAFAARIADIGAFADWAASSMEPAPGFVTLPGVFSANEVDAGSALLARHLPHDLKGKGADLGAGWGWLAAEVLKRDGVKRLALVEAEALALDCARRNLSDARATFHWADATDFSPGPALDFVVMNPPFHVTRAADPDLGAAFVRAAARMLHPQGRLYMVANRTLPYEEPLGTAFRHVATTASEGGFKIFAASHPAKGR